ncbi:MAG: alpha/beta fold hydrolase [Myxococcaceae bacterium]
MGYQRVTHFIQAADGTAIAYHTHLGGLANDEALDGRPAVVLSNGIGTTENFWRFLVKDLERDHRVVHWDYRGHGCSGPGTSRDYRMAVLADDLARITEVVMRRSHGVPPVHVGFSMGVTVLMELYRAHPEQIRALGLIAGAPDAPGTGTLPFRIPGLVPALRGAMAALQPVLPLVAPAIRLLLRSKAVYPAARAVGLIQQHAPREDIDEFLRGIASMDPTVAWRMARCLMNARASDVLPRIKVPVLIVAAGRDEMMPKVQVDAMRAALPGARYVEVPEAGHAGLVEEGPAFAGPVRGWLDEVEGR